jgi:O-antigen/teichoic acid export membrane protein
MIKSNMLNQGLLSSAFMVLSKAIGVVISLLVAKISYPYLGIDQFGFWMTINSISGLLVFSDLGLSSVIVNCISHSSSSKKDKIQLKKDITSSIYLVISSTLFIAAMLLILINLFDMYDFFGLKLDSLKGEMKPVLIIFIMLFIINTPSNLGMNIFVGDQKSYIVDAIRLISSILSLIVMYLATRFNANFHIFVLSYSGTITFINLIAALYVFYRYKSGQFKPDIKLFSWPNSLKLLKQGSVFTSITILNLLSTSIDAVLIANTLGPKDVAIYSVTKQLFFILTIVAYTSNPFWPIFGKALQGKNFSLIRSTYKSLTALTAILSVTTIIPIILFGRGIIELWLDADVVPSQSLLIGFAFLSLLFCIIQPTVNVMQNKDYTKIFLRYTLMFSMISLVAKILLIKKYGIEGIVWGTSIIFFITYVIPLTLALNKKLDSQIGKSNSYRL